MLGARTNEVLGARRFPDQIWPLELTFWPKMVQNHAHIMLGARFYTRNVRVSHLLGAACRE